MATEKMAAAAADPEARGAWLIVVGAVLGLVLMGWSFNGR